jgi:hypothetical protein
MSKVQLQGNVSGTGVFTIASPNSNTDRTLTLPDVSGTIQTTGAAITASQLPAGSILQVLQWGYNSVYENTSQNVEYDLPSPLGDGTINITPSQTSSRIRVQAQINAGQEDTWRANYFKSYFSIAGGSWNQFSGTSSIGYIENTSGGMQSVVLDYVLSLSTTSNVRIKITQIGHLNGGYLHLNQNNTTNTTAANNTINAYTTVTLTEIKG